MVKFAWLSIIIITCLSAWLQAAPVGAVLYREGSAVHYARYKVPANAAHHYFGFLEGPAWENNYCAYRVYVDSANRNALDFIAKYQPAAVLSHFDDPTVDEHTNFSGDRLLFHRFVNGPRPVPIVLQQPMAQSATRQEHRQHGHCHS